MHLGKKKDYQLSRLSLLHSFMKLNPSSLNMEMKFHAAFKRKEVIAHFAKWYDGVNKQLYHLHRAVINYI